MAVWVLNDCHLIDVQVGRTSWITASMSRTETSWTGMETGWETLVTAAPTSPTQIRSVIQVDVWRSCKLTKYTDIRIVYLILWFWSYFLVFDSLDLSNHYSYEWDMRFQIQHLMKYKNTLLKCFKHSVLRKKNTNSFFEIKGKIIIDQRKVR